MVFRKPYGFLIKHFRLIHLILTALYFYLASKVNGIFLYYDRFIDGNASKLEAMSYVTDFYVIAIIASVVICLIIYALMRYKRKPRLLYLVLIALYLAVSIMIQVSYEGLHTISISVLDTKTLRLYRDLLQIFLWIQYLSIIFVLIRGLGFDIKKFNFVKDLQELNLDVSDEEEVELSLGGTQVAQRKFHRGFRELKYYYLENKAFIHIILVVVVVIGIGLLTVEKEIINKQYVEGEVFETDNFSFQVLNTYITTKDSRGVAIGNLDHSFVILRISVRANHTQEELNTANLVLKVGQEGYTSEVRFADYFGDLGNVYLGQDITGSATTYLFLFSVLKEDLDQEMKFIYGEDRIVQLNPVSLDEISEKEDQYSIRDRIDLSKSSMNFGYLEILSYEIQDKFMYSYEYEVMGESYTGQLSITSNENTILHLKMNSSYLGKFTDYDILSNYAQLKYKIDDEVYTSVSFHDKTPGSYKDGIYVAVDKKVKDASSIWLEIIIRNRKYLYLLKG